MKIKHQTINISKENPFANCKLDREPYAHILTDIVKTYSDGFVLAISNEWGTGKTTFMKMWQQQLKNSDFQTIYFNAWESDFDNNPLVALMSELKTLTNANNKKIFNSILEKGAVLTKSIAPELLRSLVNNYLGERIVDVIENTAKGATAILEEEIREYSSKKKTIIEFRRELEEFVKQTNETNPLVFIVDELDRCRPNYSVEILEQIKHFFSVPGIIFVLSIDKKHLGSAIKGFYGSEQIDSDEYLRRFIDLEYSIPKPSTRNFIKYLFDFYSFKDFFLSQGRSQHSELCNDTQDFSQMAELLLTKSNSTLRQQEKIFALTRLILCSFKGNQYIFPKLLLILSYFKVMQNDTFRKIEGNEYTLQELSDLIFETICIKQKDPHTRDLLYIESLFLWFYNNDRDYRTKEDLTNQKSVEHSIVSKFERKGPGISLFDFFININQQHQYNDFNLNYLIKKINLTEPIVTQ